MPLRAIWVTGLRPGRTGGRVTVTIGASAAGLSVDAVTCPSSTTAGSDDVV